MGSINKLRLLHQARKNQWLKLSELEELQLKRLRTIIKYAYENTEFYHDKFKNANVRPEDIRSKADLIKIPITTKSELRKEGFKSILSKDTEPHKCKIIPTSGSTGTPLKIVYNGAADDFSKAINLRSMIENGLRINDRWVNIGDSRTASKPQWYQKLGFYNLETINLFEDIRDQVEYLREIRPQTIIGYPSQLNLIASYIEENNIEGVDPRVVFTTAELLDNTTREKINSAFNVNLVDLFGCIEVNRTAWECSMHQGYHMDIDAVLMEFIDSDEQVSFGERGEIVYTCLYNFSMPLIRYAVGDIGIPSDELCSCGRGLPLLKCLEGRKDDFIKLSDGKKISPIMLALVMKHTNNILEYQIIQETSCRLRVLVVVSDKISVNELALIKNNIEKLLNYEIEAEVCIVDKIIRGATGKIRSVISNI